MQRHLLADPQNAFPKKYSHAVHDPIPHELTKPTPDASPLLQHKALETPVVLSSHTSSSIRSPAKPQPVKQVYYGGKNLSGALQFDRAYNSASLVKQGQPSKPAQREQPQLASEQRTAPNATNKEPRPPEMVRTPAREAIKAALPEP